MILVDTSIWVRFLMGDPVARPMQALLQHRQVAAHEMVYGELLIGDRGGRGEFFRNYEAFPIVRTLSHSDVASLVRIRKLHGRGVSWVDVNLLASALVEGVRVWTADARFAAIAKELGISWGAPDRVN